MAVPSQTLTKVTEEILKLNLQKLAKSRRSPSYNLIERGASRKDGLEKILAIQAFWLVDAKTLPLSDGLSGQAYADTKHFFDRAHGL